VRLLSKFIVYSVYILYSPSLDQFYKGQSSDVEVRYGRHNKGLEKSTQKGKPWVLIWTTSKATRSEAVVLETKLKNLNRLKTIAFIKKYSEGIRGHDEAALIERLS
jgi:putative endonuclease